MTAASVRPHGIEPKAPCERRPVPAGWRLGAARDDLGGKMNIAP